MEVDQCTAPMKTGAPFVHLPRTIGWDEISKRTGLSFRIRIPSPCQGTPGPTPAFAVGTTGPTPTFAVGTVEETGLMRYPIRRNTSEKAKKLGAKIKRQRNYYGDACNPKGIPISTRNNYVDFHLRKIPHN
ncbi:unnamed protein product [Darwinula stevensoni]|uniref:Uncharacterized protein n=1 Tax=Darwinula stevensoni TaxID=69355 RepID=A0A7R8XEL7_9CRUS|nr:unnamed protein product [Darwinula stevensoni]CAG0889798.1 unnamed protein product [Darwinula stevensoni]